MWGETGCSKSKELEGGWLQGTGQQVWRVQVKVGVIWKARPEPRHLGLCLPAVYLGCDGYLGWELQPSHSQNCCLENSGSLRVLLWTLQ